MLHVYPAGRTGNLLYFAAASLHFSKVLEIQEDAICWHGEEESLRDIQALIPFTPTLREHRFSELLKSSIVSFLGKESTIPLRLVQKCEFIHQRSGRIQLSLDHLSQKLEQDRTYVIHEYFQSFLGVVNIIESWKAWALAHYPIHCAQDAVKTISQRDTFVAHLRFGDYLHPDHRRAYGELSEDYYSLALSHLGATERSNILFASDSVPLARVKLAKAGFRNSISFEEVGVAGPIQEFMCLVLSHRKVLSNSTFSWWAGYLSSDVARIVAPSPLSRDGGRPYAWDPRWEEVPSSWMN
jgi:hypothetical protein